MDNFRRVHNKPSEPRSNQTASQSQGRLVTASQSERREKSWRQMSDLVRGKLECLFGSQKKTESASADFD